jgi:hypothetical protein
MRQAPAQTELRPIAPTPTNSSIEPSSRLAGLTCVAKGPGSFGVTSQVVATREAPVRTEPHPTRGFLGLFKDRARGGAGIGDRINTGYWHPERSLRCPPATRLTPLQVGKRLGRRSPESVPGPEPDLFRRNMRLAASSALLVHRILYRSCLNLNAECQAPVQCFCIATEDYFQLVISFQPKPQTRPQKVQAKPCFLRIEADRSRDRRSDATDLKAAAPRPDWKN